MKITKILVPVDFSEHGDRAVSVAADIARDLGASLHVVHVVPPIPYLGPPFAPGAAFAAELRADTRKIFDDYMAGLARRGIQATGTLADGVAYAGVNRVAAEIGADLIVMTTHGRSGFEHALIGSVTERVIRTCRVPVVVVPPAASAAGS
jgi:nucleotide-binding universal stress UspA family protein